MYDLSSFGKPEQIFRPQLCPIVDYKLYDNLTI